MGFGKDGRGFIYHEINALTLGALAAEDVAVVAGPTIDEDFRIMKTEVFVAYQNPTQNEGAVVFGIAQGALTATEIEECLEAEPTDENDVPAVEQAMRAVFPLGILVMATDGGRIIDHIDRKLTWTFKNAEGWQWFAYNLDSGALTTGGSLRILAKHYGVWVR